MEIVIATLYKLGQRNGKFTKDFKEVDRKNAKVPRDYAENVSENWQNSGLIYEIDEKATKEFAAKLVEKEEKRNQLKELKQATSATVLSQALEQVVENTAKRGRKPKTE